MDDQPLGVLTNFAPPVDQTGFQQQQPAGPLPSVEPDSTPPPQHTLPPDLPPTVIADDNTVEPVDQADVNTEPDGTVRTPPVDPMSS